MKIAIALSGGIDSAFAAYLLKKQNYDLIAITFKIFDSQEETLFKAQKIAQQLQIPHYIIDFKEIFEKEVITYFVNSYAKGKTPNPCIWCNKKIKFGEFFRYALRSFKIDKFATGHYVKIEEYKNEILFKKAKDKKKDQSYFLSLVDKEVISYLDFPLGDFTKEEVRDLAQALFPFIKVKESQDICFLKGKSLKEFLSKFLPEKKGPVIYNNKIVGWHPGIYWFTIGQRKGLKLPLGKPLYIISLDPEENKIILGEKEKLFSKGLILENLNLHLSLEKWNEVYAQIRYRSNIVKVKDIYKKGEDYVVLFENPVKSVTPGQICAFYEKEYLLGGGVIKSRLL